MNSYTADHIVSLSAGAAFREKIGMYLSADRQEAVNLSLRELIVNVQDEYEVYKPKNPFLKITLDTKKHLIVVEDNMRGIPVGVREDGINSLTAAFLIPHSGGKHKEGVYISAVGINGEGNKIVCHTAKWLEVEVKRDNKVYFQRFESDEEGAKEVTEIIEKKGTKETGTKITYVPDPKVFNGLFVDVSGLRKMLKEVSYFTKGLNIVLTVDGKKEIFLSKRGLIDGLNSKHSLSKPFSYKYETEDCEVELALQWVSKGGRIRGYANGLYMPDGGAFISGFRSSLTRTFNSLTGKKYEGAMIRNVLDGFVSVKVRVGQFSNQAKTALANTEARTATSAATSNALKDFHARRQAEFLQVVELLDRLNKAEAAAERARKHVLDTVKNVEQNQKKKVFASDKLKDAEFLGEHATLLITEGDSAAGSMAQARDIEKYGILAIRGKMINALANSEEKIFENEEIRLLLSAMNINPRRYNSKKLRYGSIAICSDADSDGGHIGLLIISALQYLCPEFIQEGRLKWLRSPLYIVKKGKKEEYYFTDEEFNKVKGKTTGEVQRNKGLGGLDANQARDSMFGEKQRMDVIIPNEEGLELLYDLMGDDIEPRREFVFSKIDFAEIQE